MTITHLHRRIFFNVILQYLSKIVLKIMYRIKVEGAIDVPPGRGVLLIANHISFVDFLMMTLIVPARRVIFAVMDYELYRKPGANFICRNVAAIPITSKKTSLQVREEAFLHINELLGAGHYVLFFPEGMVTYDGKLTPFQYGLERIKKENPDCFIIPISIVGLLGGFFSRVGGLFAKGKFFREFGRQVTLKIGPAIPATRWNLEHIETKVKLMLASENAQEIDCPYPIELPAVREMKRSLFSVNHDQSMVDAKLVLDHENDRDDTGFRLIFLDHSPEGFCIEIAQPLEKDVIVKISLERLSTSCTCSVRWCQRQSADRYKVGLKIIDDIPRDRFLDLADGF